MLPANCESESCRWLTFHGAMGASSIERVHRFTDLTHVARTCNQRATVIARDGHLLGSISSDDFCHPNSGLAPLAVLVQPDTDTSGIKDVMSRDLRAIGTDTPTADAILLMETGLRHLPVLVHGRTLLMISDTDVPRAQID